MHMPKLTGLETIRLVKQFKSRLPCILLSADLDEVLIEQARRLEAFSVLAKPVTFRQITGVVCQALERTYNWQVNLRPRREL
jgi:CheY-like chemotaxis protein